ncbi:LytR/AlgR family response regulator transcription factor [Maribellus luteus]|nr:LytTR family DNA-binding domain-containing protein [Maribellus luteus]
MEKIRSIIIDDELNNCENLKNILERYCPEVEVAGIAHNAAEGLGLISRVNPQLIFLDIQMPGGSGFDMLESIKQPTFDVIFVTAYNQYAIKAIRQSAIDYLLKPVNILELKEAVSRVAEKINHKYNEKLLNYLENQKNTTSERKIALPSSERLLFVKIEDIVRCKGENNYTYIYLIDGSSILVSKTLKEYEEILSEEKFIRVHQSHLINARHVVSFEKSDGGYLKMSDGRTVNISRQRKEFVLSTLSRLNR